MIALRPSSAHIWTQCPGQPVMASRVPKPEPTDPSREGTCAAWVAEMVLTGQRSDTSAMISESHENGWLVTPDMAAHIRRYIEMVRSHGGQIHTERKVRLNQFVEGTPDAYAVLSAEGTLFADDLKYGYLPVEPYRNPQVSIYVGSIIRDLMLSGVTITSVQIGIYQPRAWHPSGSYRTWQVSAADLMQYVAEIEAAIPATQADSPILKAGEHCEYCPAAATCAALANANYRTYDKITSDTQRHMRDDELKQELEFLMKAKAMLDGRETAVYAEAEARIARGAHIPGWHMAERRGARRFKFDAATIKMLTGGIDPVDKKMVTPAELERRGADPKIVEKLTEIPRIKPALQPIPPGYFTNMFKAKDAK